MDKNGCYKVENYLTKYDVVWVINFSFTRTAEKDKKRNKNAIPRATMLKIT